MSCRIVIEPPSTTVEEELEGLEAPEAIDDEKPLTRENIEARVNKTLSRKLETAIKVRPPGDTGKATKLPQRR